MHPVSHRHAEARQPPAQLMDKCIPGTGEAPQPRKNAGLFLQQGWFVGPVLQLSYSPLQQAFSGMEDQAWSFSRTFLLQVLIPVSASSPPQQQSEQISLCCSNPNCSASTHISTSISKRTKEFPLFQIREHICTLSNLQPYNWAAEY